MKVIIPASIWSYLSGAIAALAWLLIIDAQSFDVKVRAGYGQPQEMTFLDWVPVIPSTIAWLLLNIVPVKNLSIDSDHEHDQRVRYFAIGWTFFAILLLFGSDIAGAAIMISQLVNTAHVYTWGHIVTLIFPVLTTFSAFIFFFGRLYGDKLKFGEDEF